MGSATSLWWIPLITSVHEVSPGHIFQIRRKLINPIFIMPHHQCIREGSAHKHWSSTLINDFGFGLISKLEASMGAHIGRGFRLFHAFCPIPGDVVFLTSQLPLLDFIEIRLRRTKGIFVDRQELFYINGRFLHPDGIYTPWSARVPHRGQNFVKSRDLFGPFGHKRTMAARRSRF